MGYKIAYCAGHGGSNSTPGKRTPDGGYEWDFNNVVAIAFAEELGRYDVELSRMDDPSGKTDVPLQTRTNKANSWGANIYISFHENALEGKWGTHTGTETFYHGTSVAGKKLAQVVQSAALKAYGLHDRGLKTSNLHITRETNMPAVLIEGGFMDSTIDIQKLRDHEVLKTAGRLIAQAVAEYAGLKELKYSEPIAPPSRGDASPVQTPKPQGDENIRKLQKLLNTGGYRDKNGNKLDEDGVYGELTNSALKRVVLKKGSKGDLVKFVQELLIRAGYKLPKYGADSDYGLETEGQVRAYQKSKRIIVDGRVGQQTIRMLLGI